MGRTPKPRKTPVYVPGVTAGWHDKSKHWLTKEGKFTTEAKALEMNAAANPQDYGGFVRRFPTPITSNFELLEMSMFNGPDEDTPMSGVGGVLKTIAQSAVNYQNRMNAAYKERNKLQAVQGLATNPEDRPIPNYMPAQMQTKLSLSEYYYNVDGDVANIIDTPIELLSRQIVVTHPDRGLREEVESFLKNKSLQAVISEMWSVMREYGQAYPFEIWDDPDNPKDLIDIVMLPPKSVHVGHNWAYGLDASAYGAKWTDTLLQSVFPPAMFRILQRHWDDSPMYDTTGGVLLSGNFLRPVWDKRRSWLRYSMPMISRVFPELVDRSVYRDSVRALVEGYRYQLWVIKVGDADHIPLPEEITAVKNMVSETMGDKTGTLVWRDSPFTVEVHVPKGLQEMISNDYYGGITKEVFRKMGITSQVVSGESPGTLGSSGGRGSGAVKGDIDVQIYFERSRYQAQQIMDWISYLVKKWVKANSLNKRLKTKELDSLGFSFAPTFVEMSGRIESIYGPMYRDGALSHRTYVGASGLSSDVELEYKEDEKKARDEGLLNPPVTYAQMVVGGQGESKATTQTEPQGSPDKAGEQNNEAQKRGTMTASYPNVEIHPANITVNMPAPIVNATIPAIPAPQTQIDVHVPEQGAPVVNIEAAKAPDVTVNVPQLEQPKIIVQPAAVNVSATPINVNVPKQEPPVINVEPKIDVAAPVVNIEAAQINVPEQPAPVVNVEAAQVNIPEQKSPVINVNVPKQDAPVVNVNVPDQPAPVINVSAKSPDVNVIVPETDEEIEVTDRNPDGSIKKATKTKRVRKKNG